MTMTKQAFFKAEKISPRDKAATTSEVARQIIGTEAADRIRKTARLRQLREAQLIEPKSRPSDTAPKDRNSGVIVIGDRTGVATLLRSDQSRLGA